MTVSEPTIAVPVTFVGNKAGEGCYLIPTMKFHWCPDGHFTMGSSVHESGHEKDESQVQVTLSGFWLCETPVTQRQWQELMGATPWKFKGFGVKEGPDYPASYISYEDVVSYCQRLTNQERSFKRLPDDWKYSLPTEAQWEYACRAGTYTRYSFGENEADLLENAWIDKNTGIHPEPVGQKKPNAWGLRDMHGNVWEWCLDWYQETLPGGRNPVGNSTGSVRVNRGGCWNSIASECRSACRDANAPVIRISDIGFRVAAVPSIV